MSISQHADFEGWAEEMGYDAGRNGPTTKNCHFTIFAKPEMTRAWERGKQRGDADRSNAALDSEGSKK